MESVWEKLSKPLKDIEALQDYFDELLEITHQITPLRRQLVGVFVLFLLLLIAITWLAVRH